MYNLNFNNALNIRWMLASLFFLVSFSNAWATENIAVYLTWQHNPLTTMTIQWITESDEHSDFIQYQAKNETSWKTVQGYHFYFPENKNYLVHRLELVDLKPGTQYQFKFASDEHPYKFHTMPAQLDKPIRFVVGGDMYHDSLDIVEEMESLAAKYNPDFGLVGGDIAYAAGKYRNSKQDTERWIDWVATWSNEMVNLNGELIPVLAALGNHDVSGRFDQTPEQSLVYSALFPMPGTRGYDVIDFGNYLSIFLLDSGHAHPVSGLQTDWLKSALSTRQDIQTKFAIYHVPAYPAFRSYNDQRSVAVRNNWTALFETYGLNIAFENHDHVYKRTHPLKNNQIDKTGVVYLGDGAWAVEEPRIPHTPKELYYLSKSASVRHFILVTLQKDKRLFQGISSTGNVFDQFEQQIGIPQVIPQVVVPPLHVSEPVDVPVAVPVNANTLEQVRP